MFLLLNDSFIAVLKLQLYNVSEEHGNGEDDCDIYSYDIAIGNILKINYQYH